MLLQLANVLASMQNSYGDYCQDELHPADFRFLVHPVMLAQCFPQVCLLQLAFCLLPRMLNQGLRQMLDLQNF